MKLHDYEHKPIDSINELITHIRPYSKKRVASEYSSFLFGGVICLEYGKASIKRDDGMMLVSFDAPVVIGLQELEKDDDVFVEFTQNSEYYTISREKFFSIVDKYALWKELCKLSFYYLHLLSERELSVVRKTKYETVKYYIEYIWRLDEKERSDISLFKYIMSRANISRSSLHKIISELNKGGYIKTSRGRLIEFKKLPDAF